MAIFAMAAFGSGSTWAATQPAPPKELVEYVREAKRRGLEDAAVRQNAVAIGWPAAIVNEAILYAKTEKDGVPLADTDPARRDHAAPVPDQGVPTSTLPVTGATKPVPEPAALPVTALDRMTGTPDTIKNRAVPDDYQIGAGDVLQISIWKEPEASVPSVVVRPDGKISLPLLKEVEVLGMTPRQAEQVITDGLSKLIHGVDATVIVTTITSQKVYVVGGAKKEGPLPYTYRMTVMQAISEAGGLTDYAKRKKIYVLHTDNGKEYRLPFNYDEAIKGERMEQNIQLSPGDTLLIPH